MKSAQPCRGQAGGLAQLPAVTTTPDAAPAAWRVLIKFPAARSYFLRMDSILVQTKYSCFGRTRYFSRKAAPNFQNKIPCAFLEHKRAKGRYSYFLSLISERNSYFPEKYLAVAFSDALTDPYQPLPAPIDPCQPLQTLCELVAGPCPPFANLNDYLGCESHAFTGHYPMWFS
jgi:hypothetical protein